VARNYPHGAHDQSATAARNDARAWRTHGYCPRPTEVLKLDAVSIPEPQAGEVRVPMQAIPLNLNDLERITGGTMMVRPELPCSPRHGGDGRGRGLR